MSFLRSRWVVWPLVVLVVLALAAYVAMHLLYPTHKTPAQLSAEMKAQAALTGPAKVYAATCAHCHAPIEGTLIGPALEGRGLPPEAVKVIVRRGVRAMPAFLPSQISDAQLAELASYVSQLPAKPGAGKTSLEKP